MKVNRAGLGQAQSILEHTTFLMDQYIPEMWQSKPHSNLGAFGSYRYRLPRLVASAYFLRQIKKFEPQPMPFSFEMILEDKFRTLNACLVTNKTETAKGVTTPGFLPKLPLTPNEFDDDTPFFRIIKLLEPPKLVQSRFLETSPGSKIYFGQLTFRLLSEQSLARVKNRKSFNYDNVEPIPITKRKVFLPVANQFGRTYYYDPKTLETTWKLSPRERLSFFPLFQTNRGTFGNTGHVFHQDIKSQMVHVENHIVMERYLSEHGSEWKIHYF